MSRRDLLVAALAMLVGSCTLVHREEGRPIPRQLDELSVGVTTKARALELLGAPVSVRRQYDGDLYTWRRREVDSASLLLFPAINLYHRIEAEDREDRLSLLFGRDGLLAGIGLARQLDAPEPGSAAGADREPAQP